MARDIPKPAKPTPVPKTEKAGSQSSYQAAAAPVVKSAPAITKVQAKALSGAMNAMSKAVGKREQTPNKTSSATGLTNKQAGAYEAAHTVESAGVAKRNQGGRATGAGKAAGFDGKTAGSLGGKPSGRTGGAGGGGSKPGGGVSTGGGATRDGTKPGGRTGGGGGGSTGGRGEGGGNLGKPDTGFQGRPDPTVNRDRPTGGTEVGTPFDAPSGAPGFDAGGSGEVAGGGGGGAAGSNPIAGTAASIGTSIDDVLNKQRTQDNQAQGAKKSKKQRARETTY